MSNLKWLEWVQRLQAIPQTGLTYARDLFDVERYKAVRDCGRDGVEFFRENELPELSIMRVTAAQITRFLEYLHHPDRPTDFD